MRVINVMDTKQSQINKDGFSVTWPTMSVLTDEKELQRYIANIALKAILSLWRVGKKPDGTNFNRQESVTYISWRKKHVTISKKKSNEIVKRYLDGNVPLVRRTQKDFANQMRRKYTYKGKTYYPDSIEKGLIDSGLMYENAQVAESGNNWFIEIPANRVKSAYKWGFVQFSSNTPVNKAIVNSLGRWLETAVLMEDPRAGASARNAKRRFKRRLKTLFNQVEVKKNRRA